MNMHTRGESRSLVAPLMLIVVGSILLVSQFLPEIGFDRLWPLMVIGAGVAGLIGRR